MTILYRSIYASLFLLFCFSSQGQQRVTTFQGRTVNVFPYRIQGAQSEYYDYNDETYTFNILNGLAVPFCPEPLSDGEYIAYYQPNFDYDNPKEYRRVIKGDTFLVALVFNIKNGIKEGAVEFYKYDVPLKPLATGFYKNDLKSGNWSWKNGGAVVTGSFIDGKLNGPFNVTNEKPKYKLVTNFESGKVNGRKEIYYNGKLQEFSTWKNGGMYGPYSRYMIEGKKQLEITGFRISDYKDSITTYLINGEVQKQVFNQILPFKDMDTTEGNWFVNLAYLNTSITGNYDESYESSYIGNDKTTYYQKIVEYHDGGKKQIYFLKDKCIKVPFCVVNYQGDTLMRFSRINIANDALEFMVKSTGYDTKHSKTAENHTIYKIPVKYAKKFIGQPVSKSVYNANYFKDYIQHTYSINRPLAEFKGMVIKVDSSVYQYYKGESSANSRVNSYYVLGINKDFTIYGDDSISSTSGFNFRYPDFRLNLLNSDTLEIKEYQMIDKDVSVLITQQLSINDTVLHQKGDANVMNPANFMGYFFGVTLNMVGVSNHILLYKNKPFSGSLRLNVDTKRGIEMYNFKQTVKYKNNTLYINRFVHREPKIKILYSKIKMVLLRHKGYVSNPLGYLTSIYPLFNLEMNFKNGRLNGSQIATDKQGKTIFELNFLNGMSHHQQYFCIGRTNLTPIGENEILTHVNYDSGYVDGMLPIFNANHDLRRFIELKKGKLNGIFLEFNPDNYNMPNGLILKTNFTNDTINGDFTSYKNGLQFEQIHFDKGKANGWYLKNRIQEIEEWASDSAHNNQAYLIYYPEVKLKFKKNRVVDTIFGYFENGGYKYIAIVNDTFKHEYFTYQNNPEEGAAILQYHGFTNYFDALATPVYENMVVATPQTISTEIINAEEAAMAAVPIIDEDVWLRFNKVSDAPNFASLDIDPIYMGVGAHFTFYYKNGRKSQEGNMLANSKYGVWKYYGENGELIKEINYIEGVDSNQSLKFPYKGRLTTYYTNGMKMLEGYIVDESFSYQCNQELEVSYQDIVFTSFYDNEGRNIFNNGNCQVQDIHMNGQKRYSGQLTNGLKSGLWKYYDQAGHLESIGEYVNGEKNGRWLSGDLGGINFIDNACSVNEALSLIKEREMHDIEIIETMFENGTLISSSHLFLEKY